MRVAFIIYDGMTALDFIGVYDPVTRIQTMGFNSALQWDICAYSETVRDNNSLLFKPTKVRNTLQPYDLIVVPGGLSLGALMRDSSFISWLKDSSDEAIKASVCTGALLLGAAGMLEGKRATTHRSAFADLEPFCMEVVDQRVVVDGNIITSRGVTSSIDLGLFLCETIAGPECRKAIQKQIDYEHSPE